MNALSGSAGQNAWATPKRKNKKLQRLVIMPKKKIYALYRGEENITDGTLHEIAAEIGCSVKNLLDIKYLTRHRGMQAGSRALCLYEIDYVEGEDISGES